MRKEPKLIFWDIENVMNPKHLFREFAGFKADLGFMFSFGYKVLGEEAKFLVPNKAALENKDDKAIVERALDILDSADQHFTWYGSGHDLPYLTTRALYHGLPPPDKKKHVDLYKVAKYNLRMSSNKLGNVTKFLGVETKLNTDTTDWAYIMTAHPKAKEALQRLGEYNAQDCVALEAAYMKLRPLITNHINYNRFGLFSRPEEGAVCRNCGSKNYTFRGYRYTINNTFKRAQCHDCNHWFSVDENKKGMKVRE